MTDRGEMTASGGPSRLCDFIVEHEREILLEWERRVGELPSAQGLSRPALRDEVPELLSRIALVLRSVHTGEPATLENVPDRHALDRLEVGFELGEVAAELTALREVVLGSWERKVGGLLAVAEVRRLNRAIDEALSRSVDRFGRARTRTFAALDRVSSAATGEGDVAAFLSALMKVLLESANAVDTIALLLKEGDDVLRVRAAIGLEQEVEHQTVLRVGEGFSGTIARTRRPLLSRDASNDPLVVSSVIKRGRVRALYGVPLIYHDEVIGVAHMGSRTAFDFSSDDKQLFRAMVERATSLIVQAQLIERLRQSEERFRLLVESVRDYAIFMLDARGRVASWNLGAARIAGFDTDAIVGAPYAALFTADDVANAAPDTELRIARETGQYRAEVQRVRADGSTFWAHVNLTPLVDGAGELRGYANVTQDISERRRIEREKQRALDALEFGDVFFVLDENFRIVLVNRTHERLSKLPREQTLGRILWDVWPDLGPDTVYWQEYHRCMRERVPVQFEAYYEPLKVWTAVTAYPTREGGIAVFVRDVSERKHAERERERLVAALQYEQTRLSALARVSQVLAESGRDLRSVLDATCENVVETVGDVCTLRLLSADGKVLEFASSAGVTPELRDEMHGVLQRFPQRVDEGPSGEVLRSGRPVRAAAPPGGWPQAMRTSLRPELWAVFERLGFRGILVVPIKIGSTVLGTLSVAHVAPRAEFSDDDETLVRELADRAALAIENARLFNEAEAAARVREDVVAIVSHDLRNPISAISMGAMMLLKRDTLDERGTKAISRIYAAADRATRLIADLLDFTQARVSGLPVDPRPADVHAIAEQVVEEVRAAYPERRVELSTGGDGRGTWDPGRIAQLLANLVSNAVHHSPPETPVTVNVRGEQDEVSVVVHNGGAPIPPEILPTLFEPFRRGASHRGRQRGSLGLGLYLSKQIALAHGGELSAESSPDDGTTFTVTMPKSGAVPYSGFR